MKAWLKNMANETQLNPNVGGMNVTALNASVAVGNTTVLNSDVVSSVEIQRGTVLCDDYTVTGKLDIPTGEADLYLVTKKRQTFVAKVYRRKREKADVDEKLATIDSPYVAKIYATGEVNGFPVEIIVSVGIHRVGYETDLINKIKIRGLEDKR